MWQAAVHIFDLGHPKDTRAYELSWPIKGSTKRRFFAVMHRDNINPPGHTRLPRYARGHSGVVERVRGCHVFPDAVANGKGEDPHWLYTVVFDGRELWGEAADPTVKVSIDAWEPYLDAV